MTYGQLREVIEEALKEQNVTGAVGGYNTPKAFRKAFYKGWKQVSRPKRPSHTKMFDYLEENKK